MLRAETIQVNSPILEVEFVSLLRTTKLTSPGSAVKRAYDYIECLPDLALPGVLCGRRNISIRRCETG